MDSYDVQHLRREFPILERTVYNRPLVYLDNTATSQTPRCVVDKIREVYYTHKANVHRGVHTLSQEATELQEATRERVRGWINAASAEEVVFTRGTTEAINIAASSFGGMALHSGDEIILTVMEHHSNIVPWQLLQQRNHFKIRVVPITCSGELDLDAYCSLFNERTRMVAMCHVSNVLGTVNPIKEMIAYAHAKGAKVLIDGAQASPHLRIDVRDLDTDFYAFSAHKMYGPTGIGVLYGRKELLQEMPPCQGGGEMIAHVDFSHTTFAEIPYKFEAGTPDFVGIAAFSAAFDFIDRYGLEAIAAHEHRLLSHAMERLRAELPDVQVYGTASSKSAVLSFNLPGVHHYDAGMLLDKLGVAVRTGHHCAQPLMKALGVDGVVRASMAAYNTVEEIDTFVDSLKRVASMF